MGGTLNNILLERAGGGSAGLSPGGVILSPEEGAPTHRRTPCFHCGDPCRDDTFRSSSKIFCCQGCAAVHEILSASGLDQFYRLASAPGVRVRNHAATSAKWAYLDDPAVQERLLDFSDGKLNRLTLKIPSIHCIACVWLLENLFRLHPGIGKSQVNFARREVWLSYAPARLTLSELAALLASIGYEPEFTLAELEKPRERHAVTRRLWLQLGVAGFGFGNIMLFSIPVYLGLDSFSGPLFQKLFGYLSLALALPVLGYSAWDYWRSAWLAVKQRMLTLEVPIALGLAALYLQSAAEILSGRGAGYLDSLAALVFFLLCGRAFQQKTYDRITFDRDYKAFFPLSAIRKSAAGEETVALSELRPGDRLRIRNGELIPADARLVEGPALIDYSFVTGESEPVARAAGERLYAGGKQAGGAIEVELLKEVSQSYLASLWDHETFRKERDENLGTQTNRYSRRFTVAVIAIALAAGVGWCLWGDAGRGLKALTSVLIVACPCALALAAPFALGTGQRRLARREVFLKNALVLERLARVDTIVFDKTGTLTEAGTLEVRFRPVNSGLGDGERSRVAVLARHSTHPHAARISEALGNGTQEEVAGFREVPGGGVDGWVRGSRVRLGSAEWLRGQGVEVPRVPGCNGSASYVAIEEEVRGGFEMKHTVRADAEELIEQLATRYQLVLLSGDNEKERETFARIFSGNLRFNQSPLAKLEFIRGLQAEGRTVMMVGDGLNDAGALKQSDVGVAVVQRVGAFSPASDVILRAADVSRLPDLLDLGRKSARVVRLSFAISAVYNLAGVSIAAAGVLSPLICAVLMPLSSISVVLFASGAVSRAARKL